MLKRNSREEERVERIIRGLVKLPQNKRCINCNSLGPQYVCTTFWTFVCTNCSGVHREFTHRVKSVSMAKFSADEVAALQAGGNEQARKTYLKTWDPRRNSFPDSSNLHKLRDFIRHVYIDHKYSGERNNEKVSLEKTGAKDDLFMQKSPAPPRLVARENFFERRTSERTDQVQTDESYDRRRSFGNFSLVNRDRNSRRYAEETSSQRYGEENVRSANRRRRATANFEVVDDRFREDGVRSGGRLGSNRFSHSDLRDRSSSPVPEKRSSTCPPPLKGILHNKVPPPKLAEPPKANEMDNINGSTQVQKAASPTSAGSTDKKEQDHIVNSLNLIDFDANPEPPDSTAEVQSQQIVPYSEGGNISASASTNEMATNAPNVDSTEFLLFELSDPSIAPSGSTSEGALEGDTPSHINEGSLNTEVTMTLASTTNISLDPNYVGTNASLVKDAPALPQVGNRSIVTVSQVQLPTMYQNLTLAVPPGNDSSTSLQTSSSGQSLDKQPFCSELALVSAPPINDSTEKSSQGVSNFGQDRSSGNESVSTARKELPADIFTASHSSFATGAPGWQFHQHYGMGYGTMVSLNSVKSRNPFDLGDDGLQFQAATFPSVSSFQEVLPDMSASQGPWPQPLPRPFENASHRMPYQMIPPGVYRGQQLPNNMIPSIPQPANNSDDAFASLNPIRLPNSSNPASVGPPSLPSKRENPFG